MGVSAFILPSLTHSTIERVEEEPKRAAPLYSCDVNQVNIWRRKVAFKLAQAVKEQAHPEH